jgi:hypothetical protein
VYGAQMRGFQVNAWAEEVPKGKRSMKDGQGKSKRDPYSSVSHRHNKSKELLAHQCLL